MMIKFPRGEKPMSSKARRKLVEKPPSLLNIPMGSQSKPRRKSLTDTATDAGAIEKSSKNPPVELRSGSNESSSVTQCMKNYLLNMNKPSPPRKEAPKKRTHSKKERKSLISTEEYRKLLPASIERQSPMLEKSLVFVFSETLPSQTMKEKPDGYLLEKNIDNEFSQSESHGSRWAQRLYARECKHRTMNTARNEIQNAPVLKIYGNFYMDNEIQPKPKENVTERRSQARLKQFSSFLPSTMQSRVAGSNLIGGSRAKGGFGI